MTLTACLEGLTKTDFNHEKGYSAIQDFELGSYTLVRVYEIWARANGLGPLFVNETLNDADVSQRVSAKTPSGDVVGGTRILTFWGHKCPSRDSDLRQTEAIRAAMSQIGLPIWVVARIPCHPRLSFYSDPSNAPFSDGAAVRRYWQQFQGGFLAWSFNVQTRITTALVFTSSGPYWQSLKEALRLSASHAAQPMLCGTLALIHAAKESVQQISDSGKDIGPLHEIEDANTAETETSYEAMMAESEMQRQKRQFLAWTTNLGEGSEAEDRTKVFARWARLASKSSAELTLHRGRLSRIESSLASLKAESEAYRSFLATTDPKTAREAGEVNAMIDNMTTWLRAQDSIAEYRRAWIESLLAITNLNIAQVDQQFSKDLALESRRDNLSMMTIAAITMVFLPGTFVASFFAMPMFDWDSSGTHVVNSHFWVYWAVAVPLTMATIALWYLWFKFRRPQETASSASSRSADHVSSFGSYTNTILDNGKIVSRRTALAMTPQRRAQAAVD